MTRRVQLGVFAGGLAVYALILHTVGIGPLLEQLKQSGWVLLPVIGIYAAVYACNALAWQLILADEPHRPGFRESYAITATSFAINYITPVVNAGGEPYRVAATAAWTGPRRAVGATILYYLLHALSSFVLWFAAAVAAIVVLPRTAWHISGVVVLILGITLLAGLVLSVHRQGFLERLLNLLHHVPLLRRLGRVLEHHRDSLSEMDQQISRFWHERPAHFAAALAVDCLGRAIQVLEFWFICRGVGIPIGYGEALFIGGLAALALNAFFFMPFELGSKEGSLVGLFLALGYSAPLAIYASVVSRLRELVWIAIGLLLMWTGTLAGSSARARA